MATSVHIAGSGLWSKILPRPLSFQAGGETVTLLHALLTQTHLDRALARRLGWRGIRPSFTHAPAWTARIARRDFVYGLVFLGEDIPDDSLLLGQFALYAFPDRDESGVLRRCEAERRQIAAPDWPDRIRALSENADQLSSFIVGGIEIGTKPDGTGLEMSLTALHTEEKLGGITRPLTIGLPFFETLAASLEAVLPSETPKEHVLWAESTPEGTEVTVTLAAGDFVGRLPGRRMKSRPFLHRPTEDERSVKPLVHVLTGFLGAGKTTFLREWLEFLHGRERFTGVIQNEFGEVDLDSLVLKGTTKVEALDEGCVCCTLSDALRPGIERILSEAPAEPFIIETTGLARASGVMDALLVLNDLVLRGLLITVIDSRDVTEHPERLDFTRPGDDVECRRDQIENADVLVCAKADLVSEDVLDDLQAKLHEMNPQALIIPAVEGNAPFALLDAFFWDAFDRRNGHLTSRTGSASARPTGLFGGAKRLSPQKLPAEARYEQFAMPIPQSQTRESLTKLLSSAGPGLARAKGVVWLEDEGAVLLQYVPGHTEFQPVEEIDGLRGTGEDPASRFLVFIGEHLQRPTVEGAAP